ncbi:GNAT family N-acetyltransferase [Pelomonas sp. KK5]|uniref:GNAT family N-acetyltransferase n=1 Tax=Pelomonas sp. KK5 TaxID=1855730 RepID=UPI00097C4018|nr:GNAT family N-acetyltransferase [Pelomonas sp. KK5]
MPAEPQLLSPRLLLRAPTPALAAEVRDYQLRNAEHFRPWDPNYPVGYFDPERVVERLVQAEQAFAAGTAYRYWFARRETPTRLDGQVHVSQLARGALQSAMLGYSLDATLQGQGLMHEALLALIAEMFGPRVRLHRIQAAVRPQNLRSRKVLQRLGFQLEGLSRRYLFIDGGWRDHELFALLNEDWPVDLPP